VSFDQVCQKSIGRVIGIYKSNPRLDGFKHSGITFRVTEMGIDLFRISGPTIFVKYLPAPSRFTMIPWNDKANGYNVGDLVFYAPTGETHVSIVPNNTATPTDGNSWRIMPMPEVLAPYVEAGAYSDCMRESHPVDAAVAADSLARSAAAQAEAMELLQMEIDVLMAMGQRHSYQQHRPPRRWTRDGLVTTPTWQPGTVTTLTDVCQKDGLYPPATPGVIPPPTPGTSNDVSGLTPLVSGQSFISVVFPTPLSSSSWTFIELRVVNTLDPNPINIWPGIVTSKTASGFTVQLDGLPDSGNYKLEWTVRPIPPTVATTYLLSGPSSGFIGHPSSSFTVQLPSGTVAPGGSVTVTPNDGGVGGTFSPPSVMLTDAAPSVTFIYTPSSTGGRTISTTNGSGLTDPAGITFTATTETYLLSGPSTSTNGIASSPFTVQLPTGGTVSGTMNVTPHDGGAGGTFTPTSVAITTAAPSATFTYTAASTGAKTISVTNDAGFTDPASLILNVYSGTYLFSGPSSGTVSVASTPFTVQLPAGGAVSGTVIVTPSDSGGGGTFTPTTVNLTTGAPSATFTYTPASTGVKTLSVTNNGGLTNPANLSYTSNAASTVHLLNTLISYWPLDAAATNPRVDLAGTNTLTDGTASNTGAQAAIINNGALFTGTERLQHVDNASLQVTGDFTFSLWAKPTNISANGDIVEKDPGGAYVANNQEYGVYHHSTAGFVFYVTDANVYAVSVGTPATVNTWYHIVAWYTASDQKMRIRINDATTYVSTMTAPLIQKTANFSIGARADQTSPFSGVVDEVGFWKRVLNAAEMTQLYNGGAGWPFSSFTT
jgi:hypothetical protein